MSVYRTILAALAAVAIASPVFADDSMPSSASTEATPVMQSGDNAGQQQVASADQSANPNMEQPKINLNKATVKQLMKVKGINASKAKSIVAYRKKHGEFKTIEDLKSIKSFKKLNGDKMQMIEDQLSVE